MNSTFAEQPQTEEPTGQAGYIHAPEGCDFSVTFPSDPETKRRCESGGEGRCYNETLYSQSFNGVTSINFKLICNPVDIDTKKQYTEEVALSAVRAMALKKSLANYDADFRETQGFDHAVLIGYGEIGASPFIYMSQLWVGDHSVMAVEGEVIGETQDEADEVFKNILESIELSSPKSK